MDVILEVRNINKTYKSTTGIFNKKVIEKKVLKDISFTVEKGQFFGVVGSSGCGKSTLAKAIMRLIDIDDGEIIFNEKDIFTFSKERLRTLRPKLQIVFQNAFSVFNTKMKIKNILKEAIVEHKIVEGKKEIEKYIIDLLTDVGLNEKYLDYYPHELSGGQLQRVAIARALSLKPELIIADEIVSALDVAVQDQILSLFLELKKKRNFSMIFISHDLAVIRKISDYIMVMLDGEIIDSGDVNYIFNKSENLYTKKLILAIPKIEL